MCLSPSGFPARMRDWEEPVIERLLIGKQAFEEGRALLLPAVVGKLEVGREEFLSHQGDLEMKSNLSPLGMKEPSVTQCSRLQYMPSQRPQIWYLGWITMEGGVGRGAQIGPGSSRRLEWILALPFMSWDTLVKPLTLELKGIRWGKRGFSTGMKCDLFNVTSVYWIISQTLSLRHYFKHWGCGGEQDHVCLSPIGWHFRR